jgi:diguanylate cyclase (GGDEF)-like protein/PAS domain S-box-containing protein
MIILKGLKNQFEMLKNSFNGFVLFKIVFDSSGNPQDFEFVDVNEAFIKIINKNSADFLGRNISNITPSLFKDEFDCLGFFSQILLHGKSSVSNQYSPLLSRFIRIDAFRPQKDYLIAQMSDITLEIEMNNKLKALISATNCYTFELNEEYRYIDVISANNAALPDIRKKFIGKTIYSVHKCEQQKIIEKAFKDAKKTGDKVEIEYECDTSDDYKYLRADVICFKNLSNEKRFYLAVRDITDRSLLEKQLKQENFRLYLLNTLISEVNSKMGVKEIINYVIDRIYSYFVEYTVGFGTLDNDGIFSVVYLHSPIGEKKIEGSSFDLSSEHEFLNRMQAMESFKHSDICKGNNENKCTLASSLHIASSLDIPLRYPEKVAGVLVLAGSKPNEWNEFEESLLKEVAYFLEFAIKSAYEEQSKEEYQKELAESKVRLSLAFEGSGDGLWDWNIKTNEVYFSPRWKSMLGYEESEIYNDFFEWYERIHPENRELVYNEVQAVLDCKTNIFSYEYRILTKTGDYMWILSRGKVAAWDNDGKPIRLISTHTDIDSRKKNEEKATYLNYHDYLTGLYNRTYFEEKVKGFTNQDLPISVIMGDVNGLKLTNDVYGHVAGDMLLKKIAEILISCSHENDIIARLSGDEFCILMPNTKECVAKETCDLIYQKCEEFSSGMQVVSRFSISLGIATKKTSKDTLDEVIKTAENLMYKRKLFESKSHHSSILSSIMLTLYEKSNETEEHAHRLIGHSRAIGERLKLSEGHMNDIELLSMLHDIGKIGIDDSILTKPTELNSDELREMRSHPEIGFRIAQASPELSHIANSILSHHERWDGTGYPQGLSGKKIPLLSRILAVVDAYDAMTQDRVYRKAMTKVEICKEIENNAGTQFDPEIARIFLQYLNE